jgi:hypothetical protein
MIPGAEQAAALEMTTLAIAIDFRTVVMVYSAPSHPPRDGRQQAAVQC